MTTLPADLGDLARYAIGRPWWLTMPGMRVREVAAPGMSHTDGRWVRVDEDWHNVGVWVPDLADPSGATQGCLITRMRGLSGDPGVGIRGDYWRDVTVDWNTITNMVKPLYGWPTEAHALVAALDAAWSAV